MPETLVITGAGGFIGKHLAAALLPDPKYRVIEVTRATSRASLGEFLQGAKCVFHLAGVNRPQTEAGYDENPALIAEIASHLQETKNPATLVYASSIQAEQDNPYGRSKRRGEGILEKLAHENGNSVIIFRLKNVFGKWARPNYNSVIATFCYNISRGLPINISDPERELEVVHVQDVVQAFVSALFTAPPRGVCYGTVEPSYRFSLGELARQLHSFADARSTLAVPFGDSPISRLLYSTYLSYLPPENLAYDLPVKCDNRGSLAEFLKSQSFGQIFVSRTFPGIVRGNHYHHIKVEKFLVLEGDASICFRQLFGTEIVEYRVSGKDFRVLDIPPGYTHSIQNVGTTEMVVLFWAGSPFDPVAPDTLALPLR